MNIFKRIFSYFDHINHEIKLINLKACCIFASVFLALGITSWIIGGGADKVKTFFIFPRSALPVLYAFLLWGVGFAFLGFIVGGVLLGCEKYRRKSAHKITFFLIITLIFNLCVYPVFFGALSPIISFVLLLVSLMFCSLAIIASFRVYALWTVCISLYFLWLLYNCYVSLAFAFVN